ncbi:Abi family protein [Eremococcus coleocola]|uniref:Abi family protein n=1 Tax=Eremococcus coleocola TaxID=88132 RepID=UPI000403492C|nr:Abi family protein [Eremococcus coleocola]
MKPFRTIDEQIALLKSRHLTFLSEEQARNNLSRYGYYEIVNGYKDLFIKDKSFPDEEESYVPGATFENIFDLFLFDTRLRRAVFTSMLEVELNLRTAVSYVIGKHYGSNESDYLIRENFKSGKRTFYNGKAEYQIDQLLRKLRKIRNDDVQPMKHYRECHSNVPPWIIIKGTSFGNLLMLYKLLKAPLKNEVISILYGIPVQLVNNDPSIKQLFSDSLKLFHKYRNRSAHGGRIYNYIPEDTSIRYSPLLHSKINVDEAAYRKGHGHHGIRVLLATLSMFDNTDAFRHLYATLGSESKMLNEKYSGFMKKLSIQMNMDLSILVEVDRLDERY